MAFSVEPGIYREGEWGMRLEDIVVCGPDGPDVLNRSDLDLRVVAGSPDRRAAANSGASRHHEPERQGGIIGATVRPALAHPRAQTAC